MTDDKKIRAAIVGYGNIGRYALQALREAPDFEIAGIVRRNPAEVPFELQPFRVVSDIEQLESVDVALVCSPSREVERTALEILKKGICTADSFDIHDGILACVDRWETPPGEVGRQPSSRRAGIPAATL